jgi:hypothetical protein
VTLIFIFILFFIDFDTKLPAMKPSTALVTKLFWISLVATFAWIFFMKAGMAPLNTKVTVDFELAKTPEKAQAIINTIGPEGVKKLRYGTYLDFLLLLLYPLTIALGCIAASRATRDKSYIKWSKFFVGLIIVAGILDATENLFMLPSMNGPVLAANTSIAFYCAGFKFLFILICLLFVLLCFIPILVRIIWGRRNTG